MSGTVHRDFDRRATPVRRRVLVVEVVARFEARRRIFPVYFASGSKTRPVLRASLAASADLR